MLLIVYLDKKILKMLMKREKKFIKIFKSRAKTIK